MMSDVATKCYKVTTAQVKELTSHDSLVETTENSKQQIKSLFAYSVYNNLCLPANQHH